LPRAVAALGHLVSLPPLVTAARPAGIGVAAVLAADSDLEAGRAARPRLTASSTNWPTPSRSIANLGCWCRPAMDLSPH
jgi:hypothetical protein